MFVRIATLAIITLLSACSSTDSRDKTADLSPLSTPNTAIIVLAKNEFPEELQHDLVEQFTSHLPNAKIMAGNGCQNRHTCVVEAEKQGAEQLLLIHSSAMHSSVGTEGAIMATLKICAGLYAVPSERSLTKAPIFSQQLVSDTHLQTAWKELMVSMSKQDEYESHLARIVACNKGSC